MWIDSLVFGHCSTCSIAYCAQRSFRSACPADRAEEERIHVYALGKGMAVAHVFVCDHLPELFGCGRLLGEVAEVDQHLILRPVVSEKDPTSVSDSKRDGALSVPSQCSSARRPSGAIV
jgi:hypothetical protein